LAWVWVRGTSDKILDPLCISASATIDANNFKFAKQLGFGV